MRVSTFAGAIAVAGLVGLPAGAASALDDVRNYAFVVSERSAEVIALDIRDDSIAARFRLGDVPRQLFVLADQRLLVAAMGGANRVEVVDLGADGEVRPIAIDHAADLLQFHPEGNLMAVAGTAAGAVTLMDLGGGADRARVTGLDRPVGMIFGPEGEHLYVANGGRSEVSVIESATGRVVDGLRLDKDADAAPDTPGVASLSRTPKGWTGFAVPNAPGAPVRMYDLRHRTVLANMERGQGPSRGFSTAHGSFVVMPNNGDGTISILSMFSRSEVVRLPAARQMSGVSLGWFETAAFVSSGDGNRVFVVDLVNRTMAGAIPLPGRPGFGAVTPDGLKLYVPLGDADRIAVIDTGERKVTGYIDNVGAGPVSVHVASALAFCH